MKYFVRFPNQMFDWILQQAKNMTKREFIVYMAVVRNTVGYNRNETELACRFIQKATGISIGNISTALDGLQKKGYVILNKEKRITRVKIIFPEWKSEDQEDSSQIGNRDSSQNGNAIVPKPGTIPFLNRERSSSQIGNKERKNKENSKDNIKKAFGDGFADFLMEG